jgi:hypothetical protein
LLSPGKEIRNRPPNFNGPTFALYMGRHCPVRDSKGCEVADEKRAELYTSPGGKFIRADTLPRILAHWRSFRPPQRQTHFIKYKGELYVGEEVDKLQTPPT